MITKVKFRKGVVEIHKEETAGTSTREVVFKCTEPPHPDFINCFVSLELTAREILEVPSNCWNGVMNIDAVSFSESETTGVRGAVISGRVELEGSQSPFCFNTPHLPFEQYSEGGDAPLMPKEGIELLTQIEKEAELYMSGEKRAQLKLAI